MAYIGSCPDMCPEKERQTRFGLYMSIFERDRDNQPDEYAMVKEYRRSGADQEEPLPKDLRTPRALEITMDYLACNIMDDARSKSLELAMEWYDFLWDRLRAIRKDLTQQNICDPDSVILVERCARFHVHSCYAMNRVKDFDVDMNKRNLNDCLQMLRQMYIDLKISSNYPCPGELEFQKYDILLHLAEDHLSSNVLMKTSIHRSTNEMKFVTRIFNAYTNNDYFKFFQLMEQADYMTSCVLSLYANKMRSTALKSIASSCPPRQVTLYPFALFKHALGFDDNEDLSNFASFLNITVREKDSEYFLAINRELIAQLRRLEASLPAFKSKRMVEYKMNDKSVGQLVYGSHLPENPYRRFPQKKNVSMEFEQGNEEEEEEEEAEEVEVEFEHADEDEVEYDDDYNEDEESSEELEFDEEENDNEETDQRLEFDKDEYEDGEKDVVEVEVDIEESKQELTFHQNEETNPERDLHQDEQTNQEVELVGDKATNQEVEFEENANTIQSVELEEVEETSQEVEFEEEEDPLPMLKKRKKTHVDNIAKIMPAGRFRTYKSATKLPFLQQPSGPQSCPAKTPKRGPKFQKILESIGSRVDNEEQAIHTFRDLIEFYKSYK